MMQQRHDFQNGIVILQEVKIGWGILPVSDILVTCILKFKVIPKAEYLQS